MHCPPLCLNRAQSRRVDQIAIEQFGFPPLVLMENAGSGCARLLLSHPPCRTVVVAAGPGNNGGDGLVIARHLAIAAVQVKVLLFASPQRLSESTRAQVRMVQGTAVEIEWVPEPTSGQLATEFAELAGQPVDWLVDALLGTGFQGTVRPPWVQVIAALNQARARRFAVDLPSGLDADQPDWTAPLVHADLTGTMVAWKPCFLAAESPAVVGEIAVVGIGVPPEVVRQAAAEPASP